MSKEKPYTSTSIYRDDLVRLDELVESGRFIKRADAVRYLINFAKDHGGF